MRDPEREQVTIEFEDEDLTRATLTISPSWFKRLLGHRSRVARVHFVSVSGWRYDIDGDRVGSRLETILNDHRRWQELLPLPEARAVEESP